MKIFYDVEGDILEVQFILGKPNKRTGISLTDQITLFCDSSFQKILGFVILAYSKLLALPELPLEELSRVPEETRQKIKQLVSQAPLNRFLYLNDDCVGIKDMHISELVAQ